MIPPGHGIDNDDYLSRMCQKDVFKMGVLHVPGTRSQKKSGHLTIFFFEDTSGDRD